MNPNAENHNHNEINVKRTEGSLIKQSNIESVIHQSIAHLISDTNMVFEMTALTASKEICITSNHDHRPMKQRRKTTTLLCTCTLILSYLLLLLNGVAAQQQRTLTQQQQAESPYYYVGCYTERTDLLKESVYAKMPQTCVQICEQQSYSYAILSAERCFCTNTINANERQDKNLCNTRCMANKSQYCGGVGVYSYYSTMLAMNPAPQRLRVINATENSLTLAWETHTPLKMYKASGAETTPPMQQQQQKITNFMIKSNILHTFATQPYFAQPEFIVQSTESRFEMTDLHPATEYNITVDAMCGDVVCGSSSIKGTTLVGEPQPVPSQPRILDTTEKTITIEIPPIRNDNGPVSKILIIVEHIDPALSQIFDTNLLGDWQEAEDNGLPYYIAAELDYLDNRTRKFVVGDGQRYGRYTNRALEDAKKADIHISLGVVSALNGHTKTLYTRATHQQHTTTLDNFTYATFDAGSSSIIALTVTCVIFGVCLVLSVLTYSYLRFKTCRNRGGARNTHEMTLQQPIIERENNGFIVEDEQPPTVESFKQQLNGLIESLVQTKRLPRNALRLNVNDIVAEGRYGEVITGKLHEQNLDCQLHVISLDELASTDQARLLQEFRNLTRLQSHANILDFYGVAASADWFYFIFELQKLSLKKRLIESRRVPNSAPIQRLSTLSEVQVLQWIYELASACDYMSKSKIIHRQLCAHNIFVTAESQLKISVFGPVPYSNQRKIDLTRWLAPETLRYQSYAIKSDIWSFGVVAWECCSLGGTPYANINENAQILDAIKSGSRPAQPIFVYQDLYQLLLNCWQLEPSERISFEDIAFNIRQLMTSPRHALCFDRQNEATIRTPNENNVLDMLPFYMPLLETTN